VQGVRREVRDGLGRQGRDVDGDGPVAERARGQRARGDGGAGRDRGQLRRFAEGDGPQELGHGEQVGIGVAVLDAVDRVLAVPRGVPAPAVRPDLHDATTGVTDVLEAPLGADDGVVPPVVRREVALLVAGLHAVVERHHHHRDVLDVDDGVQPGLGERWPVVVGEPVPHQFTAAVAAVGDVAVDRQRAHPDDPGGVAPAERVDDVEVVARLLQQERVHLAAVGVPVLEVVVTAVADEVPAPDGLDLADLATADDLAHQADDGGVPEVVSDVQRGAGPGRGVQHRVGVLDRDGERLLEVDGDARAEQVDRDLGVGPVRRGDDGGVDVTGEVQVVFDHQGIRVLVESAPAARRRDVRDGHDPGLQRRVGGGGLGHVARDGGPLAHPDHRDAESCVVDAHAHRSLA
jgi:hypothetical protein